MLSVDDRRVDFSSQGSGDGLDGKSNIHLAIWLALMQRLCPRVILAENVRKFPIWVFQKYLPMSDIQTAIVSNLRFGFPIERTRRYTSLHLRTAVSLSRELCDFQSVFARDIGDSHGWSDYLVASRRELETELIWSANRATSLSGGVVPSIDDPSCFEKTMVPWESKHLIRFREHAPADVPFSLSQDASERHAWGKPKVMQTLFSGMHLIWCDQRKRWLSSRELFALQGFPTYVQFVYAMCGGADRAHPICSFNSSRLSVGLPGRDRGAVSHQAGNTMHVAVVSAAVLWVLAFTEDVLDSIPRSLPLQCSCSTSHRDADELSDTCSVTSVTSGASFRTALLAFGARSRTRGSTNSPRVESPRPAHVVRRTCVSPVAAVPILDDVSDAISVLDDASNASALTVSVPVSSNSHVSVLPGDPPAASAGFKDALLSLGSRKRKHVLH